MAGGSGSFFKNCKSEKVGEYVRGRQEGSRIRTSSLRSSSRRSRSVSSGLDSLADPQVLFLPIFIPCVQNLLHAAPVDDAGTVRIQRRVCWRGRDGLGWDGSSHLAGTQ